MYKTMGLSLKKQKATTRMTRDSAVSGSLGLQRERLLNFYWHSTSDWPLPTATMDAGLSCNRNHHRIEDLCLPAC